MGLRCQGDDECGQQTFCNTEKKEFRLSFNLLFYLPKAPWNPLPPSHPLPLGHQMSGFHCGFEFLRAVADAGIFFFYLWMFAILKWFLRLSSSPQLRNLILNMKIKSFIWASLCSHVQLLVGALWFQFTLDWVLCLRFLYIYDIHQQPFPLIKLICIYAPKYDYILSKI